MFCRFLLVLVILSAVIPLSADIRKAVEKAHRAEQEYNRHNVAGAEKLLREAIKEDPEYIVAHDMLANLLSATNRNSQAAQEFGRVLELDGTQHKLSDEHKRQVIDNQAVAYAQSGDLDRAKAIYLEVLKTDPDYAMYNYNLACVYAEMHDLDSALPYLKKSWINRANIPANLKFPDPRQDDSFRSYLDDPRFQETVRIMVQ